MIILQILLVIDVSLNLMMQHIVYKRVEDLENQVYDLKSLEDHTIIDKLSIKKIE